MPAAAAGALVGAAFGTGASVGLGAAIAISVTAAVVWVAVYALVTIAMSYAFAALSKAMANKGDLAQEASVRQQVVRSATEPRRLIYGKVRVAGPIVFANTSNVDNNYLNLVIAIGGTEITAVDEVWFNDEQLPAGTGVAPGLITTGKFANLVRVVAHLGEPGQTVDTYLQAEVTNTLWDATHVLSNTAYLYVRLIWNPEAFAQGIPRITAVVRGRKLYDPRSTLTTYSTNWALAVRDYLTHPYGLRCASTDIDDATFITAANDSDENIVLNPSGTQKRYDANGTIPLDMPRKTAIEQLLSAGAGFLVYAGGMYKLYAGKYRTPTITLTADNLSGPLKIAPRPSRADLFNMVRGQFVNPNADWQAVDFPPVKNSAYKTEDGDEEIAVDIALPFTTDSARAQRIAKIMLEKSRQAISVVFPGNLTCYRVQPCDTVMITLNGPTPKVDLGWTAKVYMCLGWTFSEGGQVVMTLQEEAAGVYDWADGAETLIDLAPNTTLASPLDVAVPTSFVVSSSGEFLVEGNGQITSRLKLVWVPPADTYVKTSGRINIQYKKNVDTGWIEIASAPGDGTTTFIGPVSPGIGYDVRIRAVNSLEVKSSWVQATNHVVIAPPFVANSDNLIPNANSEIGTPVIGIDPDGTGLVLDAVNAYAGSWVRRFTATGVQQKAYLSAKLTTMPGEQYYFEAYLKCTTAYVTTCNVVIEYYNVAGTFFASSSTAHLPTTTYTRVGIYGLVPALAVGLRATIYYGGASDSGKNLYVDNMYMRRLIDGFVIADDSVSDRNLTNGYNNDNMIPNANSELGLTAVGLVPEGLNLINDAANSFAGGWCRRLTVPVNPGAVFYLTDYIPVSPGESFLFEGYMKCVAAQVTNTSWIAIECSDTSKNVQAGFNSVNIVLGTAYTKFTVQITVPPGSVYIRPYLRSDNASNLNTGKLLYGDSFLLKRLVTGAQDGNAYSDNLIVNGSFERGNQDYVTVSTAVKEAWTVVFQPGDAPEGTYCLRLNPPGTSFGAGAGYGVVLRAFPVTPGDTYNVRCKIRHSNGNGTVVLRMFESPNQPATGFVGDGAASPYYNNFSTNIDFLSNVSNAPYTSWTQLEFVYTPVSTARWASLTAYNWGASTGALDIDEVEVRRQISTQHVEDNAVTEPIIAATAASISVKTNIVVGEVRPRISVMQSLVILTSRAGVARIDSQAAVFLQTGASSSVCSIFMAVRREGPSVAITSITLTAKTATTSSYTVITATPHLLPSSLSPYDFLYFNSSGNAQLNSGAGYVIDIGVFAPTVTSSTQFTFLAQNYVDPNAVSTVYTGGTVTLALGGGPGTEVEVLLVAPSGSSGVVGGIARLDNIPSAGTWKYIATGSTFNTAAVVSASAANRLLSVVQLKK